MIIESGDIADWIADREPQLIAAWTPEIATMLDWELPFAEAFARELHHSMMTTVLRGGTEVQFLKVVADSGSGLDVEVEKAVAERFYTVSLKLARAACRASREARAADTFVYRRTTVLGESQTSPGHLPLDGIVLPIDHPFWGRWNPPLDMDCRCGSIPLTSMQLARSGLAVTTENELSERESRLVAAWPVAFEPLLDFRLQYGERAAAQR